MKNIFMICFFLLSCSGPQKSEYDKIRKQNELKEEIYRKRGSQLFTTTSCEQKQREIYPWEKGTFVTMPKITKELFHCKGNEVHPARDSFSDCRGNHPLPLVHGKPGVYVILIDLLNYIQQKTKQRVIITSGHRCPAHEEYLGCSKEASKHLIGAEVDFYVQGLEKSPMEIVRLLFQFYKERKGYSGQKEFEDFQKYEKATDVSTSPWYNKEIFIKLFKANEGRNFDNRHSYPYIVIQVRYDRDLDERVQVNEEIASSVNPF